MIWIGLHPKFEVEHLGFIPMFLHEGDPRSAKQQIDDNYSHGGGWRHFDGFKFDPVKLTLKYPGDPPFRALAMTTMRDETIYFFDHAWLLILQPDGTWEVARLD